MTTNTHLSRICFTDRWFVMTTTVVIPLLIGVIGYLVGVPGYRLMTALSWVVTYYVTLAFLVIVIATISLLGKK